MRCACGCGRTFEPMGTNPTKHRFFSSVCRKRAHDLAVRAGRVPMPMRRPSEPEFGARVRSVPIDRAARFAWLDPPYPGCAHLYPEGIELDHGAMIGGLVEHFPDGWALSTSAAALLDVLALCPRGVRIASWHRQARPTEIGRGWEPLIICGGRRCPDRLIVDTLDARVARGWDLPGMKPPAYVRWLCDLLGARMGDVFFEPFPGSGRSSGTFLELGIRMDAGGNVPPAAWWNVPAAGLGDLVAEERAPALGE